MNLARNLRTGKPYLSNLLSTQLSLSKPYSTMAPVVLPQDRRPLIISGPSGVGKGTLYKMLMARHSNLFATSVSHTTRAPRPGEVRDVDYYYVSMAEFERLIAEGGFVEHAQFGGNRYGTSRKTIKDIGESGKVPILDIEMEGVKQIRSLPPATSLNARYIFIAPPSTTALEARLRGRGTEKEESIQKRLAQAINELEYSKTPGVHDIIIVNDDKERACDELERFIFGEKAGE